MKSKVERNLLSLFTEENIDILRYKNDGRYIAETIKSGTLLECNIFPATFINDK